MKITINIDEKHLEEVVEKMLAEKICENYMETENKYSGTLSRGAREGVKEAVKKYIYSRKDEITEKAVNQAAAEIKRKGLSRLVEQF